MNDAPEISIVLPVHNQADHVRATVESYLQVMEGLNRRTEILLVINGCRDDSLDVCNQLAAEHRNVRVHQADRAGWGLAVRTGLAVADGRILAFTNSARTDAATLGMMMILGLANPEYLLKASRRLRYPLIRRLGSVLYNLECRTLFGLAEWDVNGTPKVFKRTLLERLDLREDGDLLDLEIIVQCHRNGIPVLEVPVVSARRHGGEPTTGLRSAATMYAGAIRLWRATQQRHHDSAKGGSSLDSDSSIP